MRLHEAIRLGAMSCPQAFGAMKTHTGARCALGAAVWAVGVANYSQTKARETWPFLRLSRLCLRCAWCPEINDNIEDAIIHLNDGHRFTREEIADWLEPLELAYEAQQQPSIHMTPDELADKFSSLVLKRTGLARADLACPREKSFMTPCLARDGHLALVQVNGAAVCAGCEARFDDLFEKEQAKHT